MKFKIGDRVKFVGDENSSLTKLNLYRNKVVTIKDVLSGFKYPYLIKNDDMGWGFRDSELVKLENYSHLPDFL